MPKLGDIQKMNDKSNRVLDWILWDTSFDPRVEWHPQKGWLVWNNTTNRMEEL